MGLKEIFVGSYGPHQILICAASDTLTIVCPTSMLNVPERAHPQVYNDTFFHHSDLQILERLTYYIYFFLITLNIILVGTSVYNHLFMFNELIASYFATYQPLSG